MSKRGRADRKAQSNGGIAQLGERLLCKQEVVGSIPTGSTIERAEDFDMSSSLNYLLKVIKACA